MLSSTPCTVLVHSNSCTLKDVSCQSVAKASPYLLSSLNIKQFIRSLTLLAMCMIADPGPRVCFDKHQSKTVMRFNEHRPTNNLTMKWALKQETLASGVCVQQRRRPACASAQSNQRLCYSLAVIFNTHRPINQ